MSYLSALVISYDLNGNITIADIYYTGNICRSPMAEAVFAHTVKKNNLDDKFSKIDSAGTASYHVMLEWCFHIKWLF